MLNIRFFLSHLMLILVTVIAYVDMPILMPVPILLTNLLSIWDAVSKRKFDIETNIPELFFRFVLHLYVIIHLCTLSYLIYYSVVGDLNLFEMVLTIVFGGFVLGAFGMNAAHELMHGNKFDRFLSFIVLYSANYPHLFYQHLRIHHKWAATKFDNGTSLLGESLYSFLPRVIIDGYIFAWRTETLRLKQKSSMKRILHNKVFLATILSLIINISLLYIIGIKGYSMFLGLSVVSIPLL